MIQELEKIGALRYINSQFYFDLRRIFSYPNVIKIITNNIEKIVDAHDLVCGVPISGIPYATAYSLSTGTPMIMVRKEKKETGTQNTIEGVYSKGKTVLLLEDVINTGESVTDTKLILEQEGLVVKTIVAIIDRKATKLSIKSLLTTHDILPICTKTRQFYCNFSSKIWQTMQLKKSNLCYSYESNNFEYLLSIIDYISIIKVHADIGLPDLYCVTQLADNKGVIVINDRKYCEIGPIVSLQTENENILSQACTVHGIYGQSTLDGLRGIPCFLITQNILGHDYTKRVFQLGKDNKKFVAGFVSQTNLGDDCFIYLSECGDRTLEQTIIRDKCDVVMIDSSISINDYRNKAWECLLNRFQSIDDPFLQL